MYVCVIAVFFLSGVNLLVGTENGLKLLDRSGQGKVYSLINSRRFQQMDVLEGLNLLITISGYTQAYSSISIHLLITVRTHGYMQAVRIYDLSLRQEE